MRRMRGRGRWAGAAGAALLLAQLFTLAPGAAAQTPDAGKPIDLRGFATGQPGHASALEFGETRLVNGEVAWSGASVDADADGLKGAKLNEMNRIFQPDKAGKLTYARGSGLEIGAGTTPADANQAIITALAEAEAPPKSSDVQEVGVEGLDPLAYASLLRGTALANSNDSGLVPDVCVLGDDLSRGTGFATDVELVDTGGDDSQPNLDGPLIALDDQNPDRAVSQSTSRMKLVPTGKPNNFGLMAEVRQTIAPVTILQADDNDPETDPRAITIEVLGEWVLRVVSFGDKSSVFYGPGEVSPDTPILRIIDSADEVTPILSFQDVFGETGFDPINIPGVAQIAIGEDPRAIAEPGQNPDPASKPKVTPTAASAAVDVVRINLLADGAGTAALDFRVGHMEVSTQVPPGGVNCPIPVDKSATRTEIQVDEETTISITVHNPYDCDLTNVILTDNISQERDKPTFTIESTGGAAEPTSTDDLGGTLPPGGASETVLTWDLGTIEKGGEKTVEFTIKAVTGGVLLDIARAAGKFANCTGHDAEGLAVAGLNMTGVSVPVRVAIATPLTGAAARTTAATGAGLALAALAAGVYLRRRHIRRV